LKNFFVFPTSVKTIGVSDNAASTTTEEKTLSKVAGRWHIQALLEGAKLFAGKQPET